MTDHAPRHATGRPADGGRRGAGELEAEILAILRRAAGPLTPGEVRDQLASGRRAELSYSTVVTIMFRLHAKGLLARQQAGRGYAYRPLDEASIAAGQMSHALGSGTDRGAVLSRFVSGLSRRDAQRLRRLLDSDPAAANPAAGDPAQPQE
ncbi:MAG TPA: BlaI/MecI/CopY family transcriptional regulator [Streptosporangiaceae bacterium]